MPNEDTIPDTAVKAEATGADTVTFAWNDTDWTVPPSLDACDVTALQAWEGGKVFQFLELVLGPQQWRRFTKGTRHDGTAAAELMRTMFRDGWGVDLGE